MKRIFIITLILLIQSFPSKASSTNGKGVICKCIDVKNCFTKDYLFWNTYISPNGMPSEISFLFENGYVIPFYIIKTFFNEIKAIEEPKRYERNKFKIINDLVYWNDGHRYYEYNKKTLMIITKRTDADGKSQSKRKCNIYNKSELFKEMNKLVIKFRSEYH